MSAYGVYLASEPWDDGVLDGAPIGPDECSYCGGDLCRLGELDNVLWYRCRGCGMDWRAEVES